MYYPEFRSVELTIFPWFEEGYRIDIDVATFDGAYTDAQKAVFRRDVSSTLENPFSNVVLRLICGIIPTLDLNGVKLEIIDGSNEDQGLVQLCVDWVIYLRNITIEIKEIEGELFTIWKAESEDIDNYSTPGLNTTYELVAKIGNVTQLKDYQELLSHSNEVVKREVRYNEIITKMKGDQSEKVDLPSILPLNRPFEYDDSKIAWIKVEETALLEEMRDPYK